VSPIEVALTADAGILVLEGGADNQPAQPGLGILFAVDRGTGFRTIISDLSDGAQGGTIISAAGLAVFPAPPAAPAAPVAQDGLLTTAEDTPGTGTLQASDPTGAPLTFSLVSNGAIGTAAITNTTTGAFTYTPAPNASGLDTFTFRATNGTADSNVATVVVTITPVNDAPTAVDGTLGVSAGASAAGTLVAADIENDPLTFSVVGAPTQGTATVTDAATGAYTYTAGAGASGTDTFTFKAADGTADSNIATVVVTITAGNRPPVASDSAITTREDRSTSGTLNASDPDGDRLTHTLVSNGTKGTATITNASTGRFTYVPGANATGSDTFTFMAHDGTAASNVATVSVTITPVNDAPVAVPLSLSTTVNTAVTGQLQAVDVDGDALTFSAGKGRGPRRGTISIAPSGQVTYTPTAGFTGTDSFTFQVSDGASSATATVSVTVSP
jgi:VCBS repeat-containing protein